MEKPVKSEPAWANCDWSKDTHGGGGLVTTPDQIRLSVHGVATLSWVKRMLLSMGSKFYPNNLLGVINLLLFLTISYKSHGNIVFDVLQH